MRLLGRVHDVEGLELAAVVGPVAVGVADQAGAGDLDRPVGSIDYSLADGGLARLAGVGAHARRHADRAEHPDQVAVVEGRGLVGVPPVGSGVRQAQVPRQGQVAQARAVVAHGCLQGSRGHRDAVDLLVGHGSST